MNLIGNAEILNLRKTAFLCSRKVPASVVLRCYDWAIEQRELGNCVISGFHSTLEKDVLHYLLKGKQPVIVALARGLKKRIEPEFIKPMEQGRLAIITPFDNQVKRVTKLTATVRNRTMVEIADKIVLGYLSEGGSLEKMVREINRPIFILNTQQ